MKHDLLYDHIMILIKALDCEDQMKQGIPRSSSCVFRQWNASIPCCDSSSNRMKFMIQPTRSLNGCPDLSWKLNDFTMNQQDLPRWRTLIMWHCLSATMDAFSRITLSCIPRASYTFLDTHSPLNPSPNTNAEGEV